MPNHFRYGFTDCNGSPSKNIELTSTIKSFTLTMLILNSHCKECARDSSNGADSTRPLDQDGLETGKLKSSQRALGEPRVSVRSP